MVKAINGALPRNRPSVAALMSALGTPNGATRAMRGLPKVSVKAVPAPVIKAESKAVSPAVNPVAPAVNPVAPAVKPAKPVVNPPPLRDLSDCAVTSVKSAVIVTAKAPARRPLPAPKADLMVPAAHYKPAPMDLMVPAAHYEPAPIAVPAAPRRPVFKRPDPVMDAKSAPVVVSRAGILTDLETRMKEVKGQIYNDCEAIAKMLRVVGSEAMTGLTPSPVTSMLETVTRLLTNRAILAEIARITHNS